MRRVAVFVLIAVAGLVGGVSAVTQDRTPVANEGEASPRGRPPRLTGVQDRVPPPEDCVVAPRLVEDFAVPAGTPRPRSPLDSVDEDNLPGAPADPRTVAAIQAVAWQYTACLNAGDYRRVAALTTDASFRDWLLTDGPDVIARLLATPVALPPDSQAPLDVRGVRLLPDGRIGAVVDWCSEANFFIFAPARGRWLYDDEIGVVVTHSCLGTPLDTAEP